MDCKPADVSICISSLHYLESMYAYIQVSQSSVSTHVTILKRDSIYDSRAKLTQIYFNASKSGIFHVVLGIESTQYFREYIYNL